MCDVRQSVTVTGKMNGEPYIHLYIDRVMKVRVMKVIVMGKMYQKIPAVVCSRTLRLVSSTFLLILVTVMN